MRFRNRPYREIDQLLTQVLNSREVELREVARDGSKIDPAWDRLVPAATQLRIVALAGQNQMGAAETLLSGTDASPQELLAILSGLAQMADRLDERSRHDLGRVQLIAARRVSSQRTDLPAEMGPVVDRCLAEAYTATGDLPEAIRIYEAQLNSRPRDRTLLETIAQLRIQHAAPDDLQRAKSIYRQLEGFDPAGSAAWLRTRLKVASVCLKLGEKAECAKLLKVTRILYPELGGESLKAEYAALDKELQPRLEPQP
jgi:tetratricopeptide (TPR) repeat protein